MLLFKINEIPEGKSEETVRFTESDLDLSPFSFTEGEVRVRFEKYTGQIRVRFTVVSKVLLVCDRSLEQFHFPIQADYSVLFDASAKEISEDDQTTVKPLNIPANVISIESEVRDTLLLHIPIRKLHPRFILENGEESAFEFTTESDAEEDTIADPRWEKLKALKK
jgi:uncharacterized metal-binding protein YceD (DUF177 family)